MSNGVVEELRFLERDFAKRSYNGRRVGASFAPVHGEGPVLVSAPHAANHWRDGSVKSADVLTGGIARLLAKRTGCHAFCALRQVYADPNYDLPVEGDYKSELLTYARSEGVRLVIDLHGSSVSHVFGVELGTCDDEDSSLCGHTFAKRVLRYAIEHHMGEDLARSGKAIHENVRFRAAHRGTVTRCISATGDIACIQLEVSRLFRDLDRPSELSHLVDALVEAIQVLMAVDWQADFIEAYRAERSTSLIPHEVVRLCALTGEGASPLDGMRLIAVGPIGDPTTVICHELWGDARREHDVLRASRGLPVMSEECAYLTNRVRTLICGEDVVGAPIVLSLRCACYPIGTPKAEQVDCIMLSRPLFERLSQDAEGYEFYLCNPSAGRRMFFDPRERAYDSVLAEEKVMVPRYYRRLLGMGELPLATLTKESYRRLVAGLEGEDRELMERSYERSGRFHYRLAAGLTCHDRATLGSLEDSLGIGTVVEIHWVRKPYGRRHMPAGAAGLVAACSRLAVRFLDTYVGYREHELHCRVAPVADDRHRVCRVSDDIITLLGMQDNDKAVITYRDQSVSVRILEGDLDDETITIPAPVRVALGMTSPDDLVRVRRDVRHTFQQNSFNQSMTILGNALAAFSLTDDARVRGLFLLLGLPISFYVMFAEERGRIR